MEILHACDFTNRIVAMAAADRALIGDDLALLSLKVAAQIDKKLHGATIDQNTFDQFSETLSRTGIVDAEPATISFLQSNPAATEVFAKALRESFAKVPSDTTELANELAEIIGRLKLSNVDQSSRDDLSKMRLFCLALHKSMMSQKLPPRLEPDHAFEERLGIYR